MKIPKGKSLRAFILYLIEIDKLERFYQTEEWKKLRLEVLEYFHNECQHCLKRGRYSKAKCVHHVNHVKNRPDLALSRYFVDEKGQKQLQLVPLCDTCHNLEHPEKLMTEKQKNRFVNEERW